MTRSLGLWLHPLLLTEGTWCSGFGGSLLTLLPAQLWSPKAGAFRVCRGGRGHTALEEGLQVSTYWRASVQDVLTPAKVLHSDFLPGLDAGLSARAPRLPGSETSVAALGVAGWFQGGPSWLILTQHGVGEAALPGPPESTAQGGGVGPVSRGPSDRKLTPQVDKGTPDCWAGLSTLLIRNHRQHRRGFINSASAADAGVGGVRVCVRGEVCMCVCTCAVYACVCACALCMHTCVCAHVQLWGECVCVHARV